jgi:YD repeat-containing protein
MEIQKFKGALVRCLAGVALVGVASLALAGSASYTYDTLGRLTKVTYGNGVVITYAYDATGNRITLVVTGAP